jgi:hypothetical protein
MRDHRIERRAFLATATGLLAGVAGRNAYGADEPNAASTAAGTDSKGPDAEWIPLFNGKDLTGWKPEGNATWKVEDGMLVGAQGPGNEPGDLFTEEEFADFRLRVVYKVQWPANTGVWFRYQSPEKAYQADILEYKEPEAYSGTIYCPGKMFLAINKDPKLEKKDDWNTIIVRAQGDRLVVRLNGVKTGDVQESSYDKGRIGFQIHAGDEFKDMKLTVKEVSIRKF